MLEALATQLTGGAAEALTRSLPPVAAQPLHRPPEQGQGSGSDEFFAAVARREGDSGSTEEVTAAHVQAVFRAVAEMADTEAVRSAGEQLTAEIRRLWIAEDEVGTTEDRRPAVRSEPIDRAD